jgi:hypothetical protein
MATSDELSSFKAAGFPAAFFMIWIPDHPIFAALQTASCCYANKAVVSGIWYT